MTLVRILHIPVALVWIIGVASLLNQIFGVSNDVITLLNFLAHQNFPGVLKELISLLMVVIGFAMHGGVEKLDKLV